MRGRDTGERDAGREKTGEKTGEKARAEVGEGVARAEVGEGVARARAALWGLALGDALGMPTQTLSHASILARWGCPLTGFHPADPDHPVAACLPAATVTDDTMQAVIVAEQLLAGGGTLDPAALVEALLAWEQAMRERGSLDLLGPSTRRACEAVRAGTPLELAGRHGDTNGAAMRIAPVGIVAPPGDLAALLDLVERANFATHHTSVGLAGAAAVAAAVSAGLSGATVGQATGAAVKAAAEASRRGHWVAGADVAARIDWAVTLVRGLDEHDAVERIVTLVGTSLATQESVPAAFAVLAACPDDPWRAVRLAAALGGDTDTIAAMAGAVGGACAGPGAFPAEAVTRVGEVNGLALDELAARLWRLREPGAHEGRTTGAGS